MEDKSRFTLEDWDAPVYIGADELRHALVHMQLENKVIYGYRLLDYSAVQLPEWDDTEEEVLHAPRALYAGSVGIPSLCESDPS